MPAARFFAMGGGGFSTDPKNPALDRFLLSLAGDRLPRVCFVPTASGDSAFYKARFLAAFPRTRARTCVLSLFERQAEDLDAVLGEQDIVYVGGGSTANLLALWRLHGVDAALARASANGVIMAGVSAGMNCWFEASMTDSFDVNGCDPLPDGLGLLAGSACPHYSNEPLRRPAYLAEVGSGFPGGYAADDGVGLLFEGGQLVDVVSSRTGAAAYRVTQRDGVAVEEMLPVRTV